MIFSILIGFSLGLAVSIFNHLFTTGAFKGKDSIKNKKKFTQRYLLRQLLNALVLFLVYKNVPMLIAAAFGLTMVKNFIIIQHTLGKKGVS